MRDYIHIILWGCGLAVALALLGFLLVKFSLVTRKNSKRSTVLTASLVAAVTLWVLDHSSFSMGRPILDKVILFFVLWFSCFFVYWFGVAMGFKRNGHAHDFGESSILSMQYLDSHMINGSEAYFQETEIFANPTDSAGSDSSAPAAKDKKAVHIPVSRHNG